jgi:Protein of unknown function (DUF3105)
VGEPVALQMSGVGTHPAKQFYGPEEDAPVDDLGHVLGDGFVIVRYRPDLPAEQVDGLRAWIDGLDKAIAAAPSPGQTEAVTATTVERGMRCDKYELAPVRKFADEWFAYLGGIG